MQPPQGPNTRPLYARPTGCEPIRSIRRKTGGPGRTGKTSYELSTGEFVAHEEVPMRAAPVLREVSSIVIGRPVSLQRRFQR